MGLLYANGIMIIVRGFEWNTPSAEIKGVRWLDTYVLMLVVRGHMLVHKLQIYVGTGI